MNKKIPLHLLLMSVASSAMAQKPLPTDTIKNHDTTIISIKTDTTTKKKDADKPKAVAKIKPYKEVIPDTALTQKGLFIVHKVEDKWYFEIPDSLFGREILLVTRYSKVPGGAGIYGGEIVNQQTIRFEKGPDKNIFIRYIAAISKADSTDKIYTAVKNSYLDPLVNAFPIATYGKDSATSVIDVTDFFKGDNNVISLGNSAKKELSISMLSADRSFINSIHTYPKNVEVHTTKTFSTSASAPSMFGRGGFTVGTETGVATVELNNSFVLLPKVPMQQRLFDPRVGYFADSYTVYADDQQKVKEDKFIVRWNLEPKAEDRAKWLKGGLVEPKKQIVYYIDPATPPKWVPYLIAGINDWQKAFEAAGFKNAIVGKEWPKNDTTMSLEDSRYSVVRYFASDIENAYGPNVHDPRSGEILESHIGWYHNVMNLVHDWYMVQASSIDPKARKMKFDDELMGQLIRFVSSHEIGHTLGLRHNMGSSSQTPVELLRNKKWVEEHGHTASIMDYARFNYVAQPEDGISEAGIFPRINDYDKWAIKWGYSGTGANDNEEDRKINNQWIINALAKNPRLWFGGEGRSLDPRAQTEDLGDNSMLASAYGIKNLQRELVQLPNWTKEEGDTYKNLTQMYSQFVSQFARYMGHVVRNVGGIQETFKSVEQTGDVYTATPKTTQHQAMVFLNEQLFTTPNWLNDKAILSKIASPMNNMTVSNLQKAVLKSILSPMKLTSIVSGAERFGDTTYQVADLFTDLNVGIWNENEKTSSRRSLQATYVNTLIGIAADDQNNPDIVAIAKGELHKLKTNLAAKSVADDITKYHYENIVDQINVFFNRQYGASSAGSGATIIRMGGLDNEAKFPTLDDFIGKEVEF